MCIYFDIYLYITGFLHIFMTEVLGFNIVNFIKMVL